MKTADFDYDLPEELIAQEPPPERGASRMMVVHRESGLIEHRCIADIPEYLRSGDLMAVNNTRVIPARLYGHKMESGGAVELLLLEPLGGDNWLVLCRASRRPKPGTRLEFAGGELIAEVLAGGEEGRLEVRFECARPLMDVLEDAGITPLPPYIRRGPDDARSAFDKERYQTVYASRPGAVAAPTAGLHFSEELLRDLNSMGVRRTEVTLHVGIGTFRPVKVDDIREHRMDEERYEMSQAAADALRSTRAAGGRIVAVGSTTVRTLETVMRDCGEFKACSGRSDIFIYPPYEFRAVDVMLTNFHLPKSTLLMMVSALAGSDLIRKAYREAVQERYRFFSYGDCMLIL